MYKLKIKNCGSCILPTTEAVIEELKQLLPETLDEINISYVEMTEEEYNKLPEFAGW